MLDVDPLGSDTVHLHMNVVFAAGRNAIHRGVIKDLLPLVFRQILSLVALQDSYMRSMRECHDKIDANRTYQKGFEVPVGKAPGNAVERPILRGLHHAPTFSAVVA
jgi:hypothetical protein